MLDRPNDKRVSPQRYPAATSALLRATGQNERMTHVLRTDLPGLPVFPLMCTCQ